MSLIGLLILLLVFCVVIAARSLLAAFAVPEPIATVVWVLIVLLCVLALVDQVGIFGSGPYLRVR